MTEHKEPDGLAATHDGPDDGKAGTCMRHLLRRPPRRRTGLRRAVLVVAAFAASVGFLAVIAGAALFLRLRQGPIAFDLKPQIVAALDARVGHGFRFDLAGTAIEATDQGPALTIRRLSVADASARPVVSAPSAAIAVDPLALVFGRISPTRLDIHDVDLRLVIRPDGQVAVSAGSGEAAVPLAAAFADATHDGGTSQPNVAPAATGAIAPPAGNAALRALSVAMRSLVDAATSPDSALNALDRVDVTGQLLLDDRVHGATRAFKNAVLSFKRGADGAPTLSVAADGPAGRWTLDAHAAVRPDGTRLLAVEAGDLSVDELTLAGGLSSLGFDFDMPLSAKLSIVLAADGQIDTAGGTFALGAGYFKLDDPDHEPMLIDAAAGAFHLDPKTKRVEIDRSTLRGPGSDFTLTGHMDLPRAPGEPFAGQVDFAGAFEPERPGEKPIRIAHGGLAFHVAPSDHRFVMDRAEATGPDVDFNATAEISNGAGGLRVHTASSVRRMPVQTLARVWPSFLAAPVRAWLLVNLKGGTVESGTATADLDAADFALMKAERSVADGHVKVEFNASGLAMNFMNGVPPLVDVATTGVVTGRTFNMQVQHGSLEVTPGHRLTLADGSTFHIADNDPKPTPAVVDAHIIGGIDTVADLLSRDALKPYADLPNEAASLRGQIDGRLTVDFLIGKNVPPGSATIAVDANATNVAVDRLVGKEGLSDASLRLNVDPKTGLHAGGTGTLFGTPTTIDLRKPTGGGAGEAVIALTLDDAARARAGMSTAGLRGPVGARATVALVAGQKTRAAVDLDLGRASIDGLIPGFSKPAGRPARATLNVQQRDGGVALDNIAFEGGGAVVHGSAELDKDGDFTSAKLSQVKLSPGDDMRVYAQQGGDVLKVTVNAVNLDARPFLKWLSAPSTPGADGEGRTKGALDFELRSAILTGQNNQAVTGAELRIVRRGGQVKRVTMSGRLARQPFSVATSQIDNVPHFVVHAGDAGASLLFLDLYKRMTGGSLDANVAMMGPRLDGYATVHDFTVREDPAIKKLAVEGLSSQKRDDSGTAPERPPVDTSAMSFRKLEAYFTKTGNTVEVRDGSMFGPTLGATVAGTVDFARDRVNLSGTFVPLFGVNNLFSQLPVLGPLLGGGRHEGLVGLNYRITGSAANPVLNVNPLSVLAPGFLRQIFGALDGTSQNGAAQTDDSPRLGQD